MPRNTSSHPFPWLNVVSPLTFRIQTGHDTFIDIPVTPAKAAHIMTDIALDLARELSGRGPPQVRS